MADGAIGVATAGRVVADSAEPRLGELFDVHHHRLYRLARRLVATSDEARDLVQDTYLRAARAPHAVPREPAAEEAWLVRVLVNLCRDRWRRLAVQRRYQERRGAGDRCGTAPDAESALIAHATVWRALRELPPRRRAVIVLHELEGEGVEDIAGLLGITAVTVRWHLSVGRRELGRLIRQEEHQP